MTSPKRRRDSSGSPGNAAKKMKTEEGPSTPPSSRDTASVSPVKKNGPLGEVQQCFAGDELSRVGHDKHVWIVSNTEALFGDLTDDEWKVYADRVAGALGLLRREWLELEDKRRALTGGRKRKGR